MDVTLCKVVHTERVADVFEIGASLTRFGGLCVCVFRVERDGSACECVWQGDNILAAREWATTTAFDPLFAS